MNPGIPSGTKDPLTPINMALYIYVPISSVAGSPVLVFRLPFLVGHIFSSVGVLEGVGIFLLIAQYLFKLESVPMIDLSNNQTIRMPVKELQDFLKMLNIKQPGTSASSSQMPSPSPITQTTNLAGVRGYPTPLPPEAPLVVAIIVTADFSNVNYSPNMSFLVPIISFPGLRGALPLLILSLLATIFVRAVVVPEATGAKPIPKQNERSNLSLKFTPEELLRIISRFGKYFSSN